MQRRQIPPFFLAVWSVLAVVFVLVLLLPPFSWWLSAFMLAWFAVFETHGVVSRRKFDTLSETIWRILYVKDNRPTNLALFPLVMGLFAAFATLFVGLVAGAAERVMPGWAPVVAAVFVGIGTLGFLWRHFWRGDSR